MLRESVRWDQAHAAFKAYSQKIGADARQAETAATIATGLDLALYSGPVDNGRLSASESLLKVLIADGDEEEAGSEGHDALAHLLSYQLLLDHGIRRSVIELTSAIVGSVPVEGVGQPEAALERYGIHLDKDKEYLLLCSGPSTPTADLFNETKWRKGAHVSALKKLDGVIRPKSAVRFRNSGQKRVIAIPIRHVIV